MKQHKPLSVVERRKRLCIMAVATILMAAHLPALAQNPFAPPSQVNQVASRQLKDIHNRLMRVEDNVQMMEMEIQMIRDEQQRMPLMGAPGSITDGAKALVDGLLGENYTLIGKVNDVFVYKNKETGEYKFEEKR